jgi:hypothetical protein
MFCRAKEQGDFFAAAGQRLRNTNVFSIQMRPRSGCIIKGRVSIEQLPRNWGSIAAAVSTLRA